MKAKISLMCDVDREAVVNASDAPSIYDIPRVLHSEGLDAYRQLAPQLPKLLNPGGLAAIEIGHDQGDAVTDLLARDGLRAEVANDLAGRPRAVLLTWV